MRKNKTSPLIRILFVTILLGTTVSSFSIDNPYPWLRRQPTKNQLASPFFRVAFKAAFQLTWLGTTTDSMRTDGVRGGFVYGIDLDFGLTDNIYLGTGVYHSLIGGNTRYTQRDTTGTAAFTYNSNLQYIEVPLYLKLKTDPIKDRWVVWGRFGIAGGIKLGARTRVQTYQDDVLQTENHFNSTGGFTLFRAYVPIAAGFEYIILDRTTFYAGVQFSNGFTNVYKDDLGGQAPAIQTPTVKESARIKQFEIMVGVLF